MAYSRITTYGTGATNTFAVQFALGYINTTDVTCRVGTEVDGLGNPVYRTCQFNTPGFITISGAAPGNGVPVVFERTVDKENIPVDFTDGSEMDESNLDLLQRGIMMQVHEVLDGRFNTLSRDLDMGTYSIKNLANPVEPQDGVTKAYVDANNTSTEAAASAASAAASAASAATATTRAGEAAQARDYAFNWAQANEGVQVNDGVHATGYSAFHYAQKAAVSAAAAATFDPANFYLKTAFKSDGTANAPAMFNSTGGMAATQLNVVHPTGLAGLTLNAATAGNQSSIWFTSAGSAKWQMGRQTDNTFFLYNVPLAANALWADTSNVVGFANTPTFPTKAVGTNTTEAATTAFTVAEIANRSFSWRYSGAVTLGYNTMFAFTHGLGVTPRLVLCEVICVVAENGYAVGDVVPLATNASTSGNNRFNVLEYDATYIRVMLYTGGIQIPNKAAASSSAVNPTAGNWNVLVKAYY